MTDERVPFGKDSGGLLVHVSQVKTNGLACGLVCPDPNCERPLVAYLKGKKKKPHLGHHGKTECHYGLETTLHQYAKELIAERKTLRLPAVIHGNSILKSESKLVFDLVRLEQKHHSIVPDIIATKNQRELLIEIVVTHRCEEKKLAVLADKSLPTIEIDLSKLRDCDDLPALDEAILESSDRYWVFHPAIAQRDLDLQARELEKMKATAESLAAWLRKHRSGIRSGAISDSFKALEQCGLEHLVNAELKGSWITGKSPADWQSSLLWSLIAGERRHRSDNLYVHEVIAAMQRQKSLVDNLVGAPAAVLPLLQELVPDFAPPDQLASDYIAFLIERKFLSLQQRFQPEVTRPALEKRDAILNAQNAREEERLRIEAEKKAAQAAKEAKAQREHEERTEAKRRSLATLAVETQVRQLLADPTQSDPAKFNMWRWWRARLDSGRTPLEMLSTPSGTSTLLLRLKNLEKLLHPGASPEVDLQNLPLELHRARRSEEREAKRLAEEKADREREAEEMCEHDSELLSWLEEPLEALGQLTPRQAAGQSVAALENVRVLANQVMAAARRRKAERARLSQRTPEEFRERLSTLAKAFLGNRANQWLDTAHEFSGGQTPRVLCRDQHSFEICLSQLQKNGRA